MRTGPNGPCRCRSSATSASASRSSVDQRAEDLDGEFLQRPEVVVCPDCRTQYATFEEGDRPPEERVG